MVGLQRLECSSIAAQPARLAFRAAQAQGSIMIDRIVYSSRMPEAHFFAIACLAAVFVGLSKGGLPVIGTLGVPTLALMISPVKAAALLLPLYVLTDAVSVWLYRRHFSAPNLRVLIPAGIVGVLVGWSMATLLSDRAVSGMIGTVGLAFCLNMWMRRQISGEPKSARLLPGAFWGMLTGFTSFVSHAGSPPFQMYVLPQKLEKKVFAGTSTLLFAVINLAKVGPYMQLRPYDVADWQIVMWLVPAALLGTLAGAYLTHRLAERWFFRLVQGALFVVSLRLLYQALVGGH